MDSLLEEPAAILVVITMAALLLVVEAALPTAGVAGTLALIVSVTAVVGIERRDAAWWPLLGPAAGQVPEQMQRATAKQAEAERERRAKIIAAEGELQASQKLGEAAAIISASPGALQLRQLQTMVEISAENSSTVIFPIPIQLLDALETLAHGSSRRE